MDDKKIQQTQNVDMSIAVTPDNNKDKQLEVQSKPRKNSKKMWITVGIVVSVIAAISIVIGILAANGVFNDNSCPPGEYRRCGILPEGKSACGCYSSPYVVLKPIIYLYPEKETEVTVRLGKSENLTSSYPKYSNGWNVIAHPDGTLVDRVTGVKLYSLYWEGIEHNSDLNNTIGFIVKGTDSARFLEEKLEILGLNYKEKEEFIIYWLPKLESHNYNYIYFATKEEIEKEMPLELSVNPDSVIRIRMIFEGLDEYKEIEEQILTPAPERKGFTVVEWGGTDLTKQ